jgi:hypothetical protein
MNEALDLGLKRTMKGLQSNKINRRWMNLSTKIEWRVAITIVDSGSRKPVVIVHIKIRIAVIWRGRGSPAEACLWCKCCMIGHWGYNIDCCCSRIRYVWGIANAGSHDDGGTARCAGHDGNRRTVTHAQLSLVGYGRLHRLSVCVLRLMTRVVEKRGVLRGSARLCEYGCLWGLRCLQLRNVKWVGRRE